MRTIKLTDTAPATSSSRLDDVRRHSAFARAAYDDPAYPTRQCDRCGQPYNGPAVYCSFDCAIADA